MTVEHKPNAVQQEIIEQLQADGEIPADANQWFDDACNVAFLGDWGAITIYPDGGVSKGRVKRHTHHGRSAD